MTEPTAAPVSPVPGSPAPPAPKSRAGRDLKAAIVSGVLLAALIIGTLAIREELFLPVVVVAVGIGAWELRRALASARIDVPLVPLAIGEVSMLVGAFLRGPETLVITFVLTGVAILVWRAADGVDGAIGDIAGGLLVALYPCFLGGFAALLLAQPDGALRIVFFILVTACSDIGGYAAGVLFGKHPMAPSLSPKKSWEGFAGSLALSAVAGAVALVVAFGGTWWAGALTGLLVATAATIGDFTESSIKRDLGIKDMGTLIPGHGGIMDRLDSLLICAPVVWALLLVFVPA